MIFTEQIPIILISAVVGAVVGQLLNHWFTVRRDRRREIKDAVNRVKSLILGKAPTNHDLAVIRSKVVFWKRRGFDKAVKSYKDSKGPSNQEPDGMGGFSYKDPVVVNHAINDLLKYMKRG